MDDLREILKKMKKLQARWCTEMCDDAEEMWIEVPEFLDWAVPIMEEFLKGSNQEQTGS